MTDALLTVRLSSATKEKLELLAKDTKRSKSFLAAEAITRFIEEQAQIIEGIRAGLEDAKAGRVTSHEDAMKTIYATIDKANKRV
ncbi:MAG TPA: CopG family transcriptional regulator [Methylocella sp.]|nr:CopG family transcriptional regulator [Methylocella sp.]